MAIVLKPALSHGYRLSAYQRKPNDFYPTPSELAISLAIGLPRLGLDLPRVALDPCGGDGALRQGLAPFGVDVRLSDLYPDKYPGVDGYVTSQSLDASDPEHLTNSLELAGPDCTAIVTNSPHNTDEACAIVRNLISLVEGSTRRICRGAVSGQSGVLSRDDCPISTGHPSSAKSFVVGALGGSQGVKEARCTLTRGTSGGRSHGAAHL